MTDHIERAAKALRFVMYGVPESRSLEGSHWLTYAKVAIDAAGVINWQTAKVSIDMDTHFDGDGLRVFGRVVDWQPEDWEAGGAGKGIGLRLLCEYESDNFGMTAAMQPSWQTLSSGDCCRNLYQIGGALRRMRKTTLALRAEKIADALYPGEIKPAPIVPRTTT